MKSLGKTARFGAVAGAISLSACAAAPPAVELVVRAISAVAAANNGDAPPADSRAEMLAHLGAKQEGTQPDGSLVVCRDRLGLSNEPLDDFDKDRLETEAQKRIAKMKCGTQSKIKDANIFGFQRVGTASTKAEGIMSMSAEMCAKVTYENVECPPKKVECN